MDANMTGIELTKKGKLICTLNKYDIDLSFHYMVLNTDYFNFENNKFNKYSFNNIFYVELDNNDTLLVSPILHYYSDIRSDILNLYIRTAIKRTSI